MRRRIAEPLERLRRRAETGGLSPDPVAFPHRYPTPLDAEAAAFLAATFSFGSVRQIGGFLSRLFDLLSPSPHFALTGSSPVPRGEIGTLSHRFVSPEGVYRFLRCVRAAYLEHGSLERLYLAGRGDACPELRRDLGRFLSWFRARWGGAAHRERDFLFPRPERGCACKRHNLFLRWMVRGPDGVDLGIWSAVSPRDLVVPLDTHMARMGACLGLSKRKTPDWKMAEEITASLRSVCPEDPVRFDFPLTRLGILGECTRARRGDCPRCPVASLCSRRKSGLPPLRPLR